MDVRFVLRRQSDSLLGVAYGYSLSSRRPFDPAFRPMPADLHIAAIGGSEPNGGIGRVARVELQAGLGVEESHR
jgi:hypothetical protein